MILEFYFSYSPTQFSVAFGYGASGWLDPCDGVYCILS